MFLEEVTLKYIQPCTTEGTKIKVRAGLSTDITELFPYMNGYIKGAMYNKTAKNFTFKQGEKIITLFSDKLAITKLLNESNAYEMMDYVKGLINEIYEKKSEINPSDEMKKLPSPLEIYKHLPKTNCKECNEATCMAFARKLLNGEGSIKKCQALYTKENEKELEKLEEMILLLGYEV